MTPNQFLLGHREVLPTWLAQFSAGDPFSRDHFFSSRIVYYPGSGSDGQPVKLFGSAHCAHCFIYADYGIAQNELEQELNDLQSRFRGYRTLYRVQLRQQELLVSGWTPHISPTDSNLAKAITGKTGNSPYGFMEILAREDGYGDDHGPLRLAILFLGADGVAAYDALFCQESGAELPYALVLQDHGFGGNYTSFGRGGLLDRLAKRCKVLPTWLLVGENTKPWSEYTCVPEVSAEPGGMHGTLRSLYQKTEHS